MIYEFSINIVPYDSYSFNNTFGGAYSGIKYGEVDFVFGFYLMNVDHERYRDITVIGQVAYYR